MRRFHDDAGREPQDDRLALPAGPDDVRKRATRW